jgi:hypothetical protein
VYASVFGTWLSKWELRKSEQLQRAGESDIAALPGRLEKGL